MPNPLASLAPVLQARAKRANILCATNQAVEDLKQHDQDEVADSILAAEIHADDTSDAARERAQAKLREVEDDIDERAAELWGLTQAELKEIKRSLEELG